MTIPPDAVVSLAKLTGYLLLRREWDDKSKFLARGGFTRDNPHVLLAAIRELAATTEAVEDGTNEYGVFLRAEGVLAGPSGTALEVATIWLQSRADGQVRFVTLKPLKEKRS